MYQDALLTVWNFDLGPLEDDLRKCYAPSPRGGDPWSPTCMLRTVLLAHLVGAPETREWAQRLTESAVLRALSGFFDAERPARSTFYDFFRRLHDGYTKPGTRLLVPSFIERARSQEAREMPKEIVDEPSEAEPQPDKPDKSQKMPRKEAERKKAGKKKVDRKKDPRWTTPHALAYVDARSGKRGEDLDRRLADFLWKGGVLPSVALALLPSSLMVAGDGSSLVTAASGLGTRVCDHDPRKRCICNRRFSDPDATRGYDSYRHCYYFGYKFYEVLAPETGLPLMVTLHGANVPDGYSAPVTLDYLQKTNEAHGSPLTITHFIGDTGHDNEAFSRWLLEKDIQPIIAIRDNVPNIHPKRPDLALSARAIPLCEAGAEMASWGTRDPRRPIFVCPVKAGKLDQCPKAPPDHPGWLCRPQDALAPTVTLNSDDNPRLFPPTARNSKAFTKAYAKRSACERSNNLKKGPHALEDCRHRRLSFWKIRVTLIALLQHAKAWVANLSAAELLDGLLTKRIAAAA